MSYPQYSRYESGLQLPSLAQAIHIGEQLQGSTAEVVLQWSRAQLEDPAHVGVRVIDELLRSARGELTTGQVLRTGELRPSQQEKPAGIPLDDVLVFSRAHLRLFQSDPRFRDFFSYVNSFAGADGLTAAEIARGLELSEERASQMGVQLVELGVLRSAQGRFKAQKGVFYFPEDEDFFELRNQNFRHEVDSLLRKVTSVDLAANKGLRSLLTREFTPAQAVALQDALNQVFEKAVDLPMEEPVDRLYSLCLIFGERLRKA